MYPHASRLESPEVPTEKVKMEKGVPMIEKVQGKVEKVSVLEKLAGVPWIQKVATEP
jgi:hypothetical protein